VREILTAKREINNAIREFRKRIASIGGTPKQLKWGFPNGNKVICTTYFFTSIRGEVTVGLPGVWPSRVPHLFRLTKEQTTPDSHIALTPDVEINIPLELDGHVSGVYVRDGKAIWLCSRGRFNAFRKTIPLKVALAHFDKWLVEANDADQMGKVISVGALDSPSLADDLGYFIEAVKKLKDSFRLHGNEVEGIESHWIEGEEFEGTKTKVTKGGATTYEFLHGPICNALGDALKSLLQGQHQYKVRRSGNVDRAIVESPGDLARVIFEVKTASSLGPQLYSAIGQLLSYRARYGNSHTSLFLVLPIECVGGGFQQQSLFESLGIGVLIRKGAGFAQLDGSPLETVLKPLLKLK